MSRFTLVSARLKTVAVLLILLSNCLPAMAQETLGASPDARPETAPAEGQTDALERTVQSLTLEVKELTSIVRQLKEEVQQLRNARDSVVALPPRVEEEQQLLSAKIEEQYQTKVESASKYRVRLSGFVLLNLFNNRGVVDAPDFPGRALQPGSVDLRNSFGGSLRQSMLGFQVFGPRIKDSRVEADAQFDFAGASAASLYDSPIGLLRLRTAVVRLAWPKTTVSAGQDVPFFSPLSPTSVASMAEPAFSYSGNLWTWQPQVRAEHVVDLTENSSVLLQGGILQPLWSGQPAYATRIAWNRTRFERQIAIGAAGYYSRQNWGAAGRIVDAWSASSDWTIPLSARWDLSGEFYRGKAIGQLGGGVGQTIVTSGAFADPNTNVYGIHSTGGWAQLKFQQTDRLEWNAAVGQDNPFARDLRRFPRPNANPETIARNRSALLNFIYRPRSDVVVSGEYRRIRTFGLLESRTANHLSINMGVLF